MPAPDAPPANTGRPTTPRPTYSHWLIEPHDAPIDAPARSTNNVCIVIGTGWMGITMFAPTTVSAANATDSASPAAMRRTPEAGTHAAAGAVGNDVMVCRVGAFMSVYLACGATS